MEDSANYPHGEGNDSPDESSFDDSEEEENGETKLTTKQQQQKPVSMSKQFDDNLEGEGEFVHQHDLSLNLGIAPNPKEKRKERNKLLARKSRMKMKSELETLKSQLVVLMKENETLKEQMNSIHTPPVNVRALVNNDIQLPDNIAQLIKQLMSKTDKAITPRKIKRSSFCITNAISVDIPIVYASPGFLKLTGYEMTEILGRNCRFLQGPKTDLKEVAKMKDAILEGRDICVQLLNYRKDGKTFWNQIELAHLKDQSGKTFLIVGIQTKVKPNSVQSQQESSKISLIENSVSNGRAPFSKHEGISQTHSASPRGSFNGYTTSPVLLYPDMKYYRPGPRLPIPLSDVKRNDSSDKFRGPLRQDLPIFTNSYLAGRTDQPLQSDIHPFHHSYGGNYPINYYNLVSAHQRPTSIPSVFSHPTALSNQTPPRRDNLDATTTFYPTSNPSIDSFTSSCIPPVSSNLPSYYDIPRSASSQSGSITNQLLIDDDDCDDLLP